MSRLICLVRTLQFLVSPHIGSLSDKYGRKKILLITMIGNILSALVCVTAHVREQCSWQTDSACPCSWIRSTTFASYMLSRVIGGLSEGNVQLAMYVIPRYIRVGAAVAHLAFKKKKSNPV